MQPGPADLIGRIEELIARLEGPGDEPVRRTAKELVRALLDFHGQGLARILELLDGSGTAGRSVAARLAADELVASLLMLHGQHPVPLEERVRRALDEVRPRLASHGGGVTLVGLDDGVAKLRLEGSCHGCGSSAETVRVTVEEALWRAAPDLAGIEVDGAAPAPRGPSLPVLARPAGASCELCAAAVAADHPHLLEVAARKLRCACAPCGLLFEGRRNARYRTIQPKLARLDDFRMSDAEWDACDVPVNLAFLVRESATDGVLALYPGPAGVTEARPPVTAWRAIVAANPVLETLAPDVEALLVNRVGDAREHWIASIDECFRLAGLLRGPGSSLASRDVSAVFARFLETGSGRCSS